MFDEKPQQAVELINHDLATVTVKIATNASPRSIERQLARVIKPFRCPKTPDVRRGVQLMLENPDMTAGEASQQVCGTQQLTRRIGYWASKLISGGSR